jgi:superfamily II DNA or RNA helicase
MSLKIHKQSLTKDDKKKISFDLFIEEKSSLTGEKRSVKAFSTDEEHAYLPHAYALEHFREEALKDWRRQEYVQMNAEFSGSLLEQPGRDQKSVAVESWKHLMEAGCVLLNARPGFGKTMLFTAITCRLKMKTLVLCTQDRLIDQAMGTFREVTNAKMCKLSSVKKVEDDLWDDTDVFFSTEKSSHKLSPYKHLIGTLVIDECHEFCSTTRAEAILQFRPKYIVCCSASLDWKKDGLEQVMWNFCSKDRAVVRKFEEKFYVVRYNCANNIVVPMKNGKLDYLKYMRDLHQNEKLLNDVLELIRLNIPDRKILVLAKHVDYVDKIRDAIIQRDIYPTPSVLRGTISVYRDAKILIGTFQKIGTGFDPKSDGWDGVHFDMLMLVDSTRTTCLLEQLYGRVFRANLPVVVNMVCNNHISRAHYNCHRKWYASYSNAVFLDCDLPVRFKDHLEQIELLETAL